MERSGTVLNYSSAFKQRRIFNWLMLATTYMMVYMGRYNLNATSHDLQQIYGLSYQDYANIGVLGFFVYGVSMLISGPLSDRLGTKKAILLATAGTAIFNTCIGFLFFNEWTAKLMLSMSLLYGLNMAFQSFIAIAVIKGNAPWFHVRERGRYGGWFGAILSCGYFMAITVGGFILAYLPIWWVFFIPSMILVCMFLIDMFVIKNKPSDAGYPNIDPGDATSEEVRANAGKLLGQLEGKNLDWNISNKVNSLKSALSGQDLELIEQRTKILATAAESIDIHFEIKTQKFFDVLKWAWSQKVIRRLTYSEFCTGFVRQGIMYWFILYLAQIHQVTRGTFWFSFASIGITVGGILGAITCGQLSDRVFKSRRPPVAFIFYLMQAVSLVLLQNSTGPIMAAFTIPVLAMWIFGVHGLLTGTATMDFGGVKAAATVTGMLDGIQYIASTICVFGMGWLIASFAWDYWAYSLVPFSIAGAILMLTIWNATPSHKRAGH